MRVSTWGNLLHRAREVHAVGREHRFWFVPAARGQMPYQRPAVHRTIVVVDVEGFGNPHRANPHLVAVRDGLYRVLRQAFSNASIPWASCDHEDRGDGVFVLIPPDVPKSLVAEALPRALAAALRAHNSAHTAAERIRLRLAVHAGEISYDDHGVASTAVNLTFRL